MKGCSAPSSWCLHSSGTILVARSSVFGQLCLFEVDEGLSELRLQMSGNVGGLKFNSE